MMTIISRQPDTLAPAVLGQPFSSHQKFYRFYLGEHQHPVTRLLHVIGTAAGMIGALSSLKQGSVRPLLRGVFVGYGCAWLGHFIFEKNRPATFKYPVQSFVSDLHFFTDILRGKEKI